MHHTFRPETAGHGDWLNRMDGGSQKVFWLPRQSSKIRGMAKSPPPPISKTGENIQKVCRNYNNGTIAAILINM